MTECSSELKELFWEEAERNNVLPLLGGFAAFFGMLPPMPTETRFAYAGDVQNVAMTLTPHIQGRSYAIEAELVVPEGGAEGVIVANAFVLVILAEGRRRGPAGPRERIAESADSLGGLLFLGIACLGLAVGLEFFTNIWPTPERG